MCFSLFVYALYFSAVVADDGSIAIVSRFGSVNRKYEINSTNILQLRVDIAEQFMQCRVPV